ncbi:hypothetical protein BDD14_5379 [Edaphobacter modestus]|uniref:Uncharacterized protein n=1 Tax=Edaphobacter modestus TaxID=388466 RepID=A0A4Q7Z294_9BACT|nr:hypothetical protein BDD14_5379 [Edaphobacter modestus]
MNKYFAEFIGTFFLVLTIGCTVIGQFLEGTLIRPLRWASGCVGNARPKMWRHT